jgi:hypothetical protein
MIAVDEVFVENIDHRKRAEYFCDDDEGGVYILPLRLNGCC